MNTSPPPSAPQLYSCGSNGSAQLSLGHSNDVSTFTPVVYHPSVLPHIISATVVDLVSSSSHSLLLLELPDSKRLLLAAGTNSHGQLGPKCALWDITSQSPCFKIFEILHHIPGIDKDDWSVDKIASAWTTSYILYRRCNRDRDGSSLTSSTTIEHMLIATGSNDFGELGSSTSNPAVVDLGLSPGEHVEHLAAGQRHVIAVISSSNGIQRVVGWGAARKGELDAGTAVVSGEPILRTGSKGKAPARAPTLPPTRIALPIPPKTTVVALIVGASHSLALLSDGRVLGWGSNAKHQLELPIQTKQLGATWGGSYFLSDTILSTGANTHSQLLRGYTSQSETLDIISHLSADPQSITTGSEHLLVQHDSALYVGGWNEHGNLGLGDQLDRAVLTPVNLEPILNGRSIKRVWGGCAATWILVE